MSEINEHLERLIIRQLDGELSADEQLLLQKELIKNPAARQLADEYARTDLLAGAVLQDALFRSRSVALQPMATVRATRQRHWSRAWIFIPGAIAAALLAMIVPFPGVTPVPDTKTQMVERTHSKPVTGQSGHIPQIGPVNSDGVMRTVSDSPWLAPRTRRDTGRELIGVQGDDGNIYWLEISRTRTVRQPQRAAVTSPVTESL